MSNKNLHISALLHDIGKILQKASDSKKGTHSELGHLFVKNYISDESILHGIKHHHKQDIKSGLHSNAYIVYEADNIASGADRREEVDSYDNKASNLKTNLYSIFDFKQDSGYKNYMQQFDEHNILIPLKSINENSKSNYKNLQKFFLKELENVLKDEDINISYLLSVLEKYTIFVPSTTLIKDSKDISLYDHLKLTCAVAGCMDLYFKKKLNKEYKSAKGVNKRDEEMYTLATIQLEGYEDFIFNVTNENALKNLRGRSFYIEILLKNLVNDFLDQVELNESNILYISGNKVQLLLPNTSYVQLLLPNTSYVQIILKRLSHNVNKWLLKNFDVDLYLITESVNCTANILMNESNIYFG